MRIHDISNSRFSGKIAIIFANISTRNPTFTRARCGEAPVIADMIWSSTILLERRVGNPYNNGVESAGSQCYTRSTDSPKKIRAA